MNAQRPTRNDSRCRRFGRRWPSASLLLGMLLAIVTVAAVSNPTSAHAPALAVAELDQPLWAAPGTDSAILAELPAGSEMELTGSASGSFVEVIAVGTTGWVDVNLIHAGQISTATTTAMTTITAEPSEEGRLLGLVPAGETVILTGAEVDAYLAGAYEGTGGWLPAANLE